MTKSKNKKYTKHSRAGSLSHLYCNGILVNKFVNLLTNNGKKSNKYKLLLKSLSISKHKILLKASKWEKNSLWREINSDSKRFSDLNTAYLTFKESFTNNKQITWQKMRFSKPFKTLSSAEQESFASSKIKSEKMPVASKKSHQQHLRSLPIGFIFPENYDQRSLSGISISSLRSKILEKKINDVTDENCYTGHMSEAQPCTPVPATMVECRVGANEVRSSKKIGVPFEPQSSTAAEHKRVAPAAKFKALQNEISKLLLFYQAIVNVKPSVETRKVRVGGVVYQVPSIIQKLRQEGIAMRWLIMSAFLKKRSISGAFSNCLSQELLDCLKKEGQSWQKRDQIHILAANNRAYARYRWW